jgi:hypothetical protein
MVGKLNLDLGEDYAYDIRRAREVAEGGTRIEPIAPGEMRGPFPSLTGGAPYWLRVRPRNKKWEVGFDVDQDPDADVWTNLKAFVDNPQIVTPYRKEIEARAKANGWDGES